MTDKVYTHCLRCGRKLKTDEARKRGYGKVCAEKLRQKSDSRLFPINMLYLNQEKKDGRK